MRPLLSLGALCVLVQGCVGAQPETLSCRPGDSTVVLGYRSESPPERLIEGTGVQHELGDHYLYVTADCRYFAWEPRHRRGGLWSPVRTGELTATELEQLNETVWTRDLGVEPHTDPDLFDAPTRTLWLGARTNTCQGECRGASGDLTRAVEAAEVLLRALYDRGADVEGPMRVFVHVYDVPDGEDLFPFQP